MALRFDQGIYDNSFAATCWAHKHGRVAGHHGLIHLHHFVFLPSYSVRGQKVKVKALPLPLPLLGFVINDVASGRSVKETSAMTSVGQQLTLCVTFVSFVQRFV